MGICEGSGYMADEPLEDRNHRFTASRSSERNVAISTVGYNEDRGKSWLATVGKRRCIPRQFNLGQGRVHDLYVR